MREALSDRINTLLGGNREGYIQVLYGTMLSIVADECIRQMEWARRRGIRFGLVCRGLRDGLVTDSASGEDEIANISKRDPITLAPEDWKP